MLPAADSPSVDGFLVDTSVSPSAQCSLSTFYTARARHAVESLRVVCVAGRLQGRADRAAVPLPAVASRRRRDLLGGGRPGGVSHDALHHPRSFRRN